MQPDPVYPPLSDAVYPPPFSGGQQPPPPVYQHQPPGYQPPPPGYQGPPPNYGQPITGQTVVVVAPKQQQPGPNTCPFCGGKRVQYVGPLAILICILCFPIGMLICCCMIEMRCSTCGK